MALVQVPDGGIDPEGAKDADSADPEHELLVEAHLAAADVQDVGDRPVGVAVLRDVGVEQEDRRPPDLDTPGRDVEVAPGQGDGDHQRLAVATLDPPDREP